MLFDPFKERERKADGRSKKSTSFFFHVQLRTGFLLGPLKSQRSQLSIDMLHDPSQDFPDARDTLDPLVQARPLRGRRGRDDLSAVLELEREVLVHGDAEVTAVDLLFDNHCLGVEGLQLVGGEELRVREEE